MEAEQQKKELDEVRDDNADEVSNQSAINDFNTIYGTLIPNRIFVGGISTDTTEADLCELFSQHGKVKSVKIIMDQSGISKGYGFVTFETREAARRMQADGERFVLGDRKLNIAPAFRKCKPALKATTGVNVGGISLGSCGLGNPVQYQCPPPNAVMHPVTQFGFSPMSYGNYGGAGLGGSLVSGGGNGGAGGVYAMPFIGQNGYVNYQYYAGNMPMGVTGNGMGYGANEGGDVGTGAYGPTSYPGIA